MRLVDIFELPEGAIPNGCMAVCQYVDENGQMKYSYIYDTQEMPLSSTLGLLELAKLAIYKQSQEEDPEEE